MIKCIMAVDEELGVGKLGSIPWPANKEDLRHFKNQTDGNIVIMGSKTWNDPCFPGPLKNRDNYVVTTKNTGFDGATIIQPHTSKGLCQAIIDINKLDNRDVWIIGGPSIIEQVSSVIDVLYLTKVPGKWDCDRFLKFPFDEFEEICKWKGTEINNEYFIYGRKR